MPRRVIDTIPRTMKLTMTMVAKTGRLMEVSEIHIKSDPPERRRVPRETSLKAGATNSSPEGLRDEC
jgi:hypothetical protein